MAIGKGFSYITQDPQWVKKVFIGSIITAFPFVEAISDGYQIQTIRNLREGNPRPLPDWKDLGGLFNQGIGLRLMIYAIYVPTYITTALAIILTLAGIFGWFIEDPNARFELSIGRLLGWQLAIPLIDGIVAIMLPIVFLIVPALARRLADGESPLALINPFPTLGLIFSNLGDYAVTRAAVIAFGMIAATVALVIGNIIPVLGAWFVIAVARFWGRLVWAYSLAQMKRRDYRAVNPTRMNPAPIGNSQWR